MADHRGKAVLSDSERRDAFARLFAQHDGWLFAESMVGVDASCSRRREWRGRLRAVDLRHGEKRCGDKFAGNCR